MIKMRHDNSIEWILLNDSVLMKPVFNNKKKFEWNDKQAHQRVLKEIFLMDEYKDYMLGKMSTNRFVNRFIEQKCVGLIYPEFMEMFKQGVEHIEDVTYILHALRHQHYKLAVLSNEGKGFADVKLENSYLGRFEKQIYSWKAHALQPDRKFYEYALKKTHAKACECLYIDSNMENCMSAESVGLRYIHAENTQQLEEKLRKMSLIKAKNIKIAYL